MQYKVRPGVHAAEYEEGQKFDGSCMQRKEQKKPKYFVGRRLLEKRKAKANEERS